MDTFRCRHCRKKLFTVSDDGSGELHKAGRVVWGEWMPAGPDSDLEVRWERVDCIKCGASWHTGWPGRHESRRP